MGGGKDVVVAVVTGAPPPLSRERRSRFASTSNSAAFRLWYSRQDASDR